MDSGCIIFMLYLVIVPWPQNRYGSSLLGSANCRVNAVHVDLKFPIT